jgi:mannose-1-phosphate guanylyltransferase
MTIMKAVLLVAGLGTRLRPLTDTTPKCLLPVGGDPLLRIWLDKLESAGVEHVLINTHWLKDHVEAFLSEERPKRKLDILTFHEPELLGSAGTLAANRAWFNKDDAFFIIYGDNLTTVDLKQMKRFHDHHDLPITLGVFRTAHPQRCGIAEADAEGTVTSFVEKPDNPQSNLAAAGVYISDTRIFDAFPDTHESNGPVLDLGYHIFPKMAGKMKCYEIDELIDIGTPQTYEKAKTAWQSHMRGEK